MTRARRLSYRFVLAFDIMAIVVNLAGVAVAVAARDWGTLGVRTLTLVVAGVACWFVIAAEQWMTARLLVLDIERDKLLAERDTAQLAYERFRAATGGVFDVTIADVPRGTKH